MKRKKRLYEPRSRAFRGYLISYISVVLIALSLLSIWAAWRIAVRMHSEDIRVMESRLYTVAEDLENQFEDMRVAVQKLASMEELRQDHVESNKFYELELLESLKKYGSTAAISDYFFLKYKGNDNIFTSSGTTLPLRLHLQEQQENVEEITGLIEEMCVETKEPLAVYKNGQSPALFVYPLQKYAASGIGMKGVLCFELAETELKKRVEKIAGRMDGMLAVFYKGSLIAGEEQPESKDCLERVSDSGHIKVTFMPDERDYFSFRNIFTPEEWMPLGCGALLLFFVALAAAYRSYQPIRRIAEKYREAAGDKMEYDLASIDLLIETLLRKEESNSRLLQEQYMALREQTVRLIARGGYSSGLLERSTMLNLHLDTPAFCRIVCVLDEVEKAEEQFGQLKQDVEELSDDGVWLYPFWGENGVLNILVALSEEYQGEEAEEAIQALLEARGITAKVTRFGICHDVRLLGREMPYGQEVPEPKETEQGTDAGSPDSVETEQKETEEAEQGKSAGKKQKNTALKAVEYIEQNCTKYDLSLDMVAQEFHITSAYLCRILKQQTGVSYKEYLTELRIAEAKKMLQDKDSSVADVCQRVGYTNVSYFIKVFQKVAGVTPAKYRDEA